jgi:hypothetical protein
MIVQYRIWKFKLLNQQNLEITKLCSYVNVCSLFYNLLDVYYIIYLIKSTKSKS